mmetsp:Transcript_25923/g.31955  ORF Transcript_25923/g.31955 Transcript_25923/m.31955 type:complete len:200 (-) Transcript_25923:195-794(-)
MTSSTTNSVPEIAGLPLHRKWVLFYDSPRISKDDVPWHENLHNCGSFSTAEQFWQVFNNVKPSSQLGLNANYHVFMEGILPMWEDPKNVKGGKFVLTLPKRDSKAGKLDEWWLFTVLSLIGETIDAKGNEICGAVVSIRKSQDRIAIWLKSCDKKICEEIGQRWKTALAVSNKTTLKYHSHKSSAASGHSFKSHALFEV